MNKNVKNNEKIVGIIAEYNPFHNGHLYQIQKIKKELNPDIIIVFMSGNFVQRGEIAICDKWERTKAALEHEVDLVIEIPFIYATQSANYFAKGSCELVKLCNCTHLCFGSESNDLNKLISFSKINKELNTDNGISHVKAYANQYGELLSNDILGINYIKHLINTNIIFYPIKRTGNNYLDTTINNNISSATSIRNAIQNNINYSHSTPMSIKNCNFNNNFFPLIKHKLCCENNLNKLFLMDEGIENWLKKCALDSFDYDEFINRATTKRYPKATIQRILIHLLTNTTKDEVNNLPELNYIRILGFNNNGQKYLNKLKKANDNLIIASKFGQIPKPYQELELKALATYGYLNPKYFKNKDEFKNIIIKRIKEV